MDSIQGISYSLNMMLTENGFPVHSIEECKRMVGNGFIELVRCAVPEGQRSNEEISISLTIAGCMSNTGVMACMSTMVLRNCLSIFRHTK